jgi:plastocyanin
MRAKRTTMAAMVAAWAVLVIDGAVAPVAARAADGPSVADFARLQADLGRLQQDLHEQKQLILNIMQADQQRYELVLQLLRTAAGQGGAALPGAASSSPGAAPSLPSGVAPSLPSRPGASPDDPAAVSAGEVGTVFGKVTLPAGTREVYVYVDGLRASGHDRTRTVEIKQKDKQFSPGTLVVPIGTRLVFPNLDTVFHNVFSPTPGGAFDAGSIKGGTASQPVSLSKAGHMEIFCNIHRGMRADVLVVPNGYFAKVDRDGEFQLAGVPVGSRKLILWGPQIKPASQRIDLTARGTTVRFTAEPSAPAPHLNKTGQAYGSYDE